jgi:phosphoribosylformylglycinamidine cyclo-ligase
MNGITYKSAGVDIRRGEAFVGRIRKMARLATRSEVIGGIGGFGGLFRIPSGRYKRPVLVSSTDGVGTKLDIARRTGRHDTIGVDLVAMCVNDVVVSGAEPLFFLDYLATGRLDPPVAKEILGGIVRGCREAGCALLGGETAEMPSYYADGRYDLAGFAVGIVDESRLINGRGIKAGDILVGLPSSGLHSNGYSLARNILLEKARLGLKRRVRELGKTVGEELLTPTRIYVKTVLECAKRTRIKGLVHITGGGMTGNIPRILPKGLAAVIERRRWTVPPVFDYLARTGRVSTAEMHRVFNMGIGMVLIVSPRDLGSLRRALLSLRESYVVIGEIQRKKSGGVLYAG